MRNRTDKEKIREWMFDGCLAFVPLIIFTIWILKCWVLTYQLHDDRYMMEFLAGKYLHRSDAHLIYIKYPLALIMQLFYNIWPGHDWYGTFLIAMQIMVIGILCWYMVRMQKKKVHKVFALMIFYILFFLCWLTEVTNFTYTTVAAFIGAAIIVVFGLGKRKWHEYILVLFLAFLCYNLRSDIFLMILPFCGILWIYHFLSTKEKSLCAFLAVLACVIGGTMLVNGYAYGSTEWKEYTEYNKARTLYYDYYYEDITNYDKYKEVYDGVGIGATGCKVMEEYDLSLYDDVIYDNMEKIVAEGKHRQPFLKKCIDAGKVIIKNGIMSSKILMLCSAFFWGIAIFFTIWYKNKKIAVLEIAFILAHLMLWFYLGYRGRIVLRVAHSMLFVQIITPLIAMYLLHTNREQKSERKLVMKKFVFVCSFILLAGISIYDVHLTKRLMANTRNEGMMQDHYELEKYCGADMDNFYFIDVNTVVSCKYRFDFKNENVYENFVNLGDWYGNSPLYREKLEEKGITSVREALLHNDNVYLIVSEYKDSSFIAESLGENVTLEKVDSFFSDMNLYGVYKVCDGKRSKD